MKHHNENWLEHSLKHLDDDVIWDHQRQADTRKRVMTNIYKLESKRFSAVDRWFNKMTVGGLTTLLLVCILSGVLISKLDVLEIGQYSSGDVQVKALDSNSAEITNKKLVNLRKSIKADVAKTANVDFNGFIYATHEYIFKKKPELFKEYSKISRANSPGDFIPFVYLNKNETNAVIIAKNSYGVNEVHFYTYKKITNTWKEIASKAKKVQGKDIPPIQDDKQ